MCRQGGQLKWGRLTESKMSLDDGDTGKMNRQCIELETIYLMQYSYMR